MDAIGIEVEEGDSKNVDAEENKIQKADEGQESGQVF